MILDDKPFANALQILETCVLVDNNLYGKLVSSLDSPVAFDENWVIEYQFCIPSFILVSCGLDNFTSKFYIASFYVNITLKQGKFKHSHSSLWKI